jgi:hypothetical protein
MRDAAGEEPAVLWEGNSPTPAGRGRNRMQNDPSDRVDI